MAKITKAKNLRITWTTPDGETVDLGTLDDKPTNCNHCNSTNIEFKEQLTFNYWYCHDCKEEVDPNGIYVGFDPEVTSVDLTDFKILGDPFDESAIQHHASQGNLGTPSGPPPNTPTPKGVGGIGCKTYVLVTVTDYTDMLEDVFKGKLASAISYNANIHGDTEFRFAVCDKNKYMTKLALDTMEHHLQSSKAAGSVVNWQYSQVNLSVPIVDVTIRISTSLSQFSVGNGNSGVSALSQPSTEIAGHQHSNHLRGVLQEYISEDSLLRRYVENDTQATFDYHQRFACKRVFGTGLVQKSGIPCGYYQQLHGSRHPSKK